MIKLYRVCWVEDDGITYKGMPLENAALISDICHLLEKNKIAVDLWVETGEIEWSRIG